ncbi:MAG: hypothetical protein K8J31_00170 [Anaerolineae bacterium]|nr:hypothetical protein [Anaerolineae bacterium]
MLDLTHILIDGSILSVLLGALIIGSLVYNPRLWLQDFPEAIRQRIPPQTPAEKRMQRLMMIPFLLLIVGVPYLSTISLKAGSAGSLPFVAAYLNTFLVLNLFNLFDAVVIDLLVMRLLYPRYLAFPGTEGLEYLLFDGAMHLRNYLKGIVFCAVFGLIITLVALL